MDAYHELRLYMTARLAQVERHRRQIETDRRHLTHPLDSDWEEQASIRHNDAVLDQLAAADHQQMAAIRAALTRMAEGTYGICRTCEAPITPQRLTALPYATQCLACAPEAEQRAQPHVAFAERHEEDTPRRADPPHARWLRSRWRLPRARPPAGLRIPTTARLGRGARGRELGDRPVLSVAGHRRHGAVGPGTHM